ncbi:MAG: YchJ family metal-binding protein [Actinomycetota bacterium]
MLCPCGTGLDVDACCGPVLAGTPAATAEALMRSRFTAFSLGDVAHLTVSWAPETRPSNVTVDPAQRWTRLEVIDTVKGLQLDTEGVVEFRAHFERNGQAGIRAERSRFRREAGRWVYVDGED